MSYDNLEQLADPKSLEYYEDEPIKVNEYREASLRYLHIISSALDLITSSDSPHMMAWGVAYALGLPCAEGVSITDRSQQLGVSPVALSKVARQFKEMVGIDESAYQFKK